MKTRKLKTIGDVQIEISMAIGNASDILTYMGTLTNLETLFDIDDDELIAMHAVYPSTCTFLREAQAVGILSGKLAEECREIESVVTFLTQLQTMQAEARGRWLQTIHRETVGYWATYWKLMVKSFGGWDTAKLEVKKRFAGLEDEYREILNESYKQARHEQKNIIP